MAKNNISKGKRAGFYLALGMGILAVIAAIFYYFVFNGSELYSLPVFLLTLCSIAAFLLFALLRLSRMGAAVMAGMLFAALILFLCDAYQPIYDQINVYAMGGEFQEIFYQCAVMLILLLITTIFSNICAWLPHNFKNKEVK